MQHSLRSVIFILFIMFMSVQGNVWNLIWKMDQKPFQEPKVGSEMAIVKAGFDTDEDGWGEFLCAYTDFGEENYLLMYEAAGNDSFDLVWYWNYPYVSNTFAGIAVGDMDNNGRVEIITTMPVDVGGGADPNPPRLWVFEWNGVQGENKYGVYAGNSFTPNNEWNFDVDDNVDFRPYSLTIEDIDGDEDNELIVGVRMGDRGREVIVASVLGEFNLLGSWNIEYNLQGLSGGSLYSVTTGDLDNDGNREIYAMIWNMFTMKIIECTGTDTYELVTELDQLYADEGIDYGALDGIRVADVNGDGVNEMYIAGTEPQNTLFMITDISDVSAITPEDVVEFYTFPVNYMGKLRSLHIDDPDSDGNLDLMVAGEQNGQIFDFEYQGDGDPADTLNWELTIAFDILEYADTLGVDPRLFYGSPAGDMDQDGKNEYVFVNYRTSFQVWDRDAYVWMIEADDYTGLSPERAELPQKIVLNQNYPNPFNPVTTIEYTVPQAQFVTIKIYNAAGQEVAVLVNETTTAGQHRVTFDGSGLPSGTYYAHLITTDANGESRTQSKKIILLK